jgi:hypothetical protein
MSVPLPADQDDQTFTQTVFPKNPLSAWLYEKKTLIVKSFAGNGSSWADTGQRA